MSTPRQLSYFAEFLCEKKIGKRLAKSSSFSILVLLFSLLFCPVLPGRYGSLAAQSAAPKEFYLLYEDAAEYEDQPSIAGKLCIMASLPPGQPITILDTKRGLTFRTQTAGQIRHYDWANDGGIELTILTESPPSGLSSSDFIAMKGNVAGGLALSPRRPGTNAIFADEIDRIIRTGTLMAEALEMSGNSYSLDDIKGIKPKIEIIEAAGFTYSIATYPLPYEEYFSGPSFVILPDKSIRTIGGPCTIPTIPFVLEGVNYIHTGSNCCDCGIIGVHVLRVEPNAVIRTFDDYGYSN